MAATHVHGALAETFDLSVFVRLLVLIYCEDLFEDLEGLAVQLQVRVKRT
jgi:hypothetical protein